MAELTARDTDQDCGTAAGTEPNWIRTTLRVPREDRSVLAEPPVADVAPAVDSNRLRLADAQTAVQGRSLSELRQWTRDTLFPLAVDYTGLLSGESIRESQQDVWLVDGHQPALFHPGVWAKNFGLQGCAARLSQPATCLHLIIDTDIVTSRRVAVPGGTVGHPQTQAVPFDADQKQTPWEDARLQDVSCFLGFPKAAAEQLRGLGVRPLADDIWQHGVSLLDQTDSLPDLLSAIRHRTERSWGVRNLELRMSHVCQTRPFLWFACHLLARHACFRQQHNEVLAAYRKINRIRSQTHPVPELTERDGWTEAPFWVWDSTSARRQRLFVRPCPAGIELADDSRILGSLPLVPDDDATQAVIGLEEMQRRGLRLRTRALTTTMFSRVFLSDLFIHGIGGAKYDEMTDRLIEQFYGLTPPDFLTLSATLYLPIEGLPQSSSADERRLQRTLRDLNYNPQRYLTDELAARQADLLSERSRLIREQQQADRVRAADAGSGQRSTGAANGYARYRRLRQINELLAAELDQQRNSVQRQLKNCRDELHSLQILRNRELSFCLYPESVIHGFLGRLAGSERA